MSIGSNNHYLRAIKMFTRWLVRDRRVHDDPLLHLSKMNVELDRRPVRRPLSGEEFALLLESRRLPSNRCRPCQVRLSTATPKHCRDRQVESERSGICRRKCADCRAAFAPEPQGGLLGIPGFSRA
ncbi:MAG: hypothetical protein MUF06_09000 [Pirellulaceae bacterium]|jgi:hypothetical protein|nr:hypothetical protein [Pirellulaceae bacterium]